MCVIILQHDKKNHFKENEKDIWGREDDDDDDADDDDDDDDDDADADGSTANIDSYNNNTAGCVSCCLSVPFSH